MICQRCMQRLARRQSISRASFSTTSRTSYATPVTAQTTTSTVSRPNGSPAATTTPAVAQPFSTPLTPKTSRQDLPITPKQSKQPVAKLPASSVPAGTVLKGLNFYKNKPDPVALEDHEYPAWLWQVLEAGKGDGLAAGDLGGGMSEADLYAKSAKLRRRAAKALRKQQLLNPDALAPKIPLHEQSVDLPAGDGTLKGAIEAGEARGELTQSMRESRRKKIKEDNFLRSMN